MKKFFLFISIIFYTLFLVLTLFGNNTAEIIYPEHSSSENPYTLEPTTDPKFLSVVRITYHSTVQSLFNTNPEIMSATGFSIKYDPVTNTSFILTNDHVCSFVNINTLGSFYYQDANIKAPPMNGEVTGSLRIIASDPSLDLCLMSTNGFIQPAIIADENYKVKQLESVSTIGGPLGIFPIIVDSKVTNLIDPLALPNYIRPEVPVFLMSEIFFHGQSGSPVFNSNNEVIGVFFVAFENSYGGGALHVKAIKIFLSENQIQLN